MRPVETSFPATPDRVDAVSEIRGGCYRYLVHTSSNTTRHNVELTEAATCSSQSGGVAEGPTCEDAPRLQVHGSTAGGGSLCKRLLVQSIPIGTYLQKAEPDRSSLVVDAMWKSGGGRL